MKNEVPLPLPEDPVVAMLYVPFQQWKTTYSLEAGLSRGTIFPKLDLPFEGYMRKGGMER